MRNVQNNLESGRLSEGELVKRFEQTLEQTFGMRNAVAVNSGTSALHLALILAGVGEGDEVILPAQTFLATAAPIVWLKAKPVFADIGMDGNIDVEDAARTYTEKTKAIIAVSWGGNPCDLWPLSLWDMKEVSLIQDNAHALGATFEGKPLSNYGDFSCYSFQAIKELTTGDGGLITTNRKTEYYRARKLRWFGIDRDFDKADETGERQFNIEKAEDLGFKYHMNDYSAALGLGNLVGFKERQARRKEIYELYKSRLVTNVPRKKDGCSHWLFDFIAEDRPNFLKAMKSRDIPVSVVHVGIDKHGVFGGTQDLPVQRYWDEHHVCLPIHSGLTDEDVDKVVEAVLKGW